jgi:glucose-1-phosphate adenylyltransferase
MNAPRKTLAILLASGPAASLHGLTRHRSKLAIPFGGHHRLVDYALSNCVASAISDIAILTEQKSQSLVRHLQRRWLSAPGSTLQIWPAQKGSGDPVNPGTAEVVFRHRDLIERLDPDDILIVAGDHVYGMDYSNLMSVHARTGADVTMGCVEVSAGEPHGLGLVEVDDEMRLKSYVEPRQRVDDIAPMEGRVPASMGVYLFSADYLLHCLRADARDPDSKHDFGANFVARVVGDANVHVASFCTPEGAPGYWRDIDSIDSYWHAHQELLEAAQTAGRDGPGWPRLGARQAGVPAKLMPSAEVGSSVIGSGSAIAGSIERSVVSTECRVGGGSRVRESVLLPEVRVGRNCRLRRVVVDSRCHIPDNTTLDSRTLGSSEIFHVSPAGVVLVTEDALHRLEAAGERRTA